MKKIIFLVMFFSFLTSNCFAFMLDHSRWEFIGYGDHNIAFFFDKINIERQGNDNNKILKTWICGADFDNKIYYYTLMSFFLSSKQYRIEDNFCRKYETHNIVKINTDSQIGKIYNVYPNSILEDLMYSVEMYSF